MSYFTKLGEESIAYIYIFAIRLHHNVMFYLGASKPKWVNTVLSPIVVISLSLGGLHL